MESETKTLFMCQNCHSEGYYLDDDEWGVGFIICPNCGFETGQVKCENEEAAGEFIMNIQDRPNPYTCLFCNSEHFLPHGFFDNPLDFHIEKIANSKKYVPVKAHATVLANKMVNWIFVLMAVVSAPLYFSYSSKNPDSFYSSELFFDLILIAYLILSYVLAKALGYLIASVIINTRKN